MTSPQTDVSEARIDTNALAITALNFESVARRETAIRRDETANLFRLAASDLRKAAKEIDRLRALLPPHFDGPNLRNGYPDEDDGPSVLGERKGE